MAKAKTTAPFLSRSIAPRDGSLGSDINLADAALHAQTKAAERPEPFLYISIVSTDLIPCLVRPLPSGEPSE
jgi:hypothetical protein